MIVPLRNLYVSNGKKQKKRREATKRKVTLKSKRNSQKISMWLYNIEIRVFQQSKSLDRNMIFYQGSLFYWVDILIFLFGITLQKYGNDNII